MKPLDFTLEARTTSVGYRQQIVVINVERIAECKRLDTRDTVHLIAERFRETFTAGHDRDG